MDQDKTRRRRAGEEALKAADRKEHAQLNEKPLTRSEPRRQKEGIQGLKSGNLGSFHLPSLSNTTSTGLLHVPSPPQSPATLTATSPRLQRRRKSDLDTMGAGVEAELARTRTNSSSRELSARTSVTRPASSPKLLRRRQTAASVTTSRSKIFDENLNASLPPMRRQSEGIVPMIQISPDDLQERVRKFNQNLEKCAAKHRKGSCGDDARQGDEESREITDNLSTTPRLPISRSRSLPSLIPVLNNSDFKNDSGEPLGLYEDLSRCRYLRIPGSPKPLTVEQIFQKN